MLTLSASCFHLALRTSELKTCLQAVLSQPGRSAPVLGTLVLSALVCSRPWFPPESPTEQVCRWAALAVVSQPDASLQKVLSTQKASLRQNGLPFDLLTSHM